MKKITIATRGSKLALWQAEYVARRIEARHPGLRVETLQLKTRGDKILDAPLAKLGGKGLFVKEIEEALLDGRADIAVHSMKDVPVELPAGLEIGVIPEREACTDSLLSVRHQGLDELPRGAVVGTSSLRRQAQLKALRPDLVIESLRGNLDTRLQKLLDGRFTAIVVATAGLARLGLSAPKSEVLGPPEFLPAAAQGALGIEFKTERDEVRRIVEFMDHGPTKTRVLAERGFLTGLDGGCQVPIAAWSELEAGEVQLTGFVADESGTRSVRLAHRGPADKAFHVGLELARRVLEAGAGDILSEVYGRGD
ncbi:MAG: hydroxymethylbilane synthase [Desulfovibrionaceae bacterium]|nr:hydroxymethylbilane synthase [Desulfovibrionaceae bacterium]